MELLPTDIVLLINKDWVNSFAEVESNKKSIAEYGWFPYNQNLLMHKQLRATMTTKDIENEKKRGLVPSTFVNPKSSVESIHYNASSPLRENDRLPITQSKLPFNFRFGEAKRCLDFFSRN